jgi:hypothetical protein
MNNFKPVTVSKIRGNPGCLYESSRQGLSSWTVFILCCPGPSGWLLLYLKATHPNIHQNADSRKGGQ